MKYTIDYFIEKFDNISDDEVGRGLLRHHCSLWHCGVREDLQVSNDYIMSEEAHALIDILRENRDHNYREVYNINDGNTYQNGTSPRTRMINRLKELKAKR